MNTSTSKKIKSRIAGSPIGRAIVVPFWRFINNPSYVYSRYAKNRVEIETARTIDNVCQSDHIKEAVIVYDLASSAPTFGDFFYVVMLARYFLLFDKRVRFWLVNSEFRQEAVEAFSAKGRREFVEQISEIPKVLLRNTDIETYSWPEALSLLTKLKDADSVFIPFEDLILRRKAFYHYCFNLINHLFVITSKKDFARFLLRAEDIIGHLNIEVPKVSYITWHTRYSSKWEYQRNLTDEEFQGIYTSLRGLFPHHRIMIVSDEKGCSHFKELSSKMSFDMLFSKDFSKSFMGDAALILKSRYFFTLRGGGIVSIPVFSEMPYGIIAQPMHESMNRRNHFAAWSTENQVYIVADRGLPEDVLGLKERKGS